MILTFILGALAGAGSHLVEPHAVRLMELAFGEKNMPGPGSQAIAGYGLALAAAALLLALASSGGSALALCLGGVVGVFHREIRKAILARMG